jgi:alpha-tubulin suppressor-like RCC1 family protein
MSNMKYADFRCRIQWRRAVRAASVAALAASQLVFSSPGFARPSSTVAPPIGRPATDFSAGRDSTCLLKTGRAYCSGGNVYGEVGDGTTVTRTRPVPVVSSGVLADVYLVQIASGGGHTCALSNTGRAFCWGLNLAGELGDGTTANHSFPVAVNTSGVLAGVTLIQITAGSDHSCALSTAGRAYCWGANQNGQLGDGTTTPRLTPVAVSSAGVLAGVSLVQIRAGSANTCVLSSAGRAYCWGDNSSGGLGDGSTVSRTQPVAVDASGVLAGVRLVQIDPGEHSCALSDNLRAFCWGRNDFGQVGDGTTTTRLRPVTVLANVVLGDVGLAQVATGYLHSCVLTTQGRAYCWGANYEGGQLGDGSGRLRSLDPVAVDTSGALQGVVLRFIDAGIFHSCVQSDVEQVYCWGTNEEGELGDATTINRPTPVAVAPIPLRPPPPHDITVRAGSRSITVSWLPPNGLPAGTWVLYTATARPDGMQCATSSTTCQITGLVSGVTYLVTVVATTSSGTSARSARSDPVTPT